MTWVHQHKTCWKYSSRFRDDVNVPGPFKGVLHFKGCFMVPILSHESEVISCTPWSLWGSSSFWLRKSFIPHEKLLPSQGPAGSVPRKYQTIVYDHPTQWVCLRNALKSSCFLLKCMIPVNLVLRLTQIIPNQGKSSESHPFLGPTGDQARRKAPAAWVTCVASGRWLAQETGHLSAQQSN